MTENSETQQLKRAQAGDCDAFSELIEKYSYRIFGACFSLLGNRQDAEDCSQDAWIKAWRALPDYNYRAAFYTWLYRIAVNTCLDYRRKTSREQARSIDEAIETEDGQITLQLTDDALLPDEAAEKAELRQMIRQALMTLPMAMREILVLRDFEQLSYGEIAGVLGVSEGTVKSRLSRARQQLAAKIDQTGRGNKG